MTLDDLRKKESESMTPQVLRSGSPGMDRAVIDNTLFDRYSLPLAELFEVSAEAMRIRLETLGLLLRKKARTLFE